MGDDRKPLDEFSAEIIANHELEQTARRLATQLAREKLRTEQLVDAVYRAAKDAAIARGRIQIPAPVKDRRKPAGQVALIHTTDWQVGKVSDSYDLDIAQARIERLAQKVIHIAGIQRHAHPVKHCAVLLGGDMVEGVGIFPGQVYEIGAHLYEQLFAVANIVEQLVATLCAEFETVTVWDIHGNHGRLGRRGENPRNDNIDRVAYAIARDRLTHAKNLTWHHAETWHQIVEIGNYTALLVHGDQIKSFGGNLPAYGILRKTNAWAAGVLPKFRDAYFGHFHTHQTLAGADGRQVFMTGSPESGNEYAREFVAATGTPSQRLHFIDPDKGRVTSEWRIELA